MVMNDGAPVVDLDDDTLSAALQKANLPTLLLVLAAMTGDDGWLSGRYRPSRTQALNDNDDAGLPPEAQAEVRQAAFSVLTAWRDSGVGAPVPPSGQRLISLLSDALGERVPDEYATTLAEEAGFRGRPEVQWSGARPSNADDFHVVVIGAGPAGVAMAITLDRLGIPFTVYERNSAVGGVWLANDYPGAGVDTPSALYSYSFTPNRSWERYYAKQAEVLGYFQRTAEEHGVVDRIQFDTQVLGCSWDDTTQTWEVRIRQGDGEPTAVRSRVVVSCAGLLTAPSVPRIDGADLFRGAMFHSSQWDHSVDVAGKRVAIIGTGATAMQIVPAIADVAAHVTVFQRSAQWVVPNANYQRDIDPLVRILFEKVPFFASFYRMRQIWMFQDKLLSTLRRDPDWAHPERSVNAVNDKHRAFLTSYLDSELGERADLRSSVLPDYPPYGKRILMDNGWIRTVKRPDVSLVASGVRELTAGGVVSTDGQEHEADVVVLATGFQATRMLQGLDVHGRQGSLRDHWGEDDATAHLGINVAHFPNFFLVGGPNTALGHGGSALYISECAIAYIAQIIIAMIERGTGSVEVRDDVMDAYQRQVDELHEELIWTHPGMSNWYRNSAGRVTATIPFRGVDYWAMTREPDFDDFVVRESGAPASRPVGTAPTSVAATAG